MLLIISIASKVYIALDPFLYILTRIYSLVVLKSESQMIEIQRANTH